MPAPWRRAPNSSWRPSLPIGLPIVVFFFSSRRRHTRYIGDWSSDVCSSDLFLQLMAIRPSRARSPSVEEIAPSHPPHRESGKAVFFVFLPLLPVRGVGGGGRRRSEERRVGKGGSGGGGGCE